MKVYIGPYIDQLSPRILAEKLLFWKDEDDVSVTKLTMWLAHGSKGDPHETWLYKLMQKFKRKRTVKIRIDKYDTWNMDGTLAMIILPMLKQLQATKHGSQVVELEDVPEWLRSTNTEDYDSQLVLPFYHEYTPKPSDPDIHTRWDWVIGEMIWAFEQLNMDWEEQYYSGTVDWVTNMCEDRDAVELTYGPNHTFKVDMEGLEMHQKRISNGLRLFGKYFLGLWD